MKLIELKARLLRPLYEWKADKVLSLRYPRKSTFAIVKKLEDFKFKLNRAEAEGKKSEAMKYQYRIEALEWVLNGHTKTS